MIVEKLSDNKKLVDVINKLHSEPWPVYLSEDSLVKKYWQRLYQVYPEYQLLFRINSEYIGVANSAPIYWNGNIDNLPTGFDEAIETIIEENEKPNTLCGLAVVISKEHLGKGISSKIINNLKKLAKSYGYSNLIFPVRPTLKSQYPTIPMDNYIKWEKDNLPFDPWLRVHIKIGGEILKVANPSMIVRGTVSDWQRWTGMYFGESNKYIIQGALNPVNIDLGSDLGEYIEPNVWVGHKC
ncbi:MAG: GNAT family N-acetyltransferase [Candidatus Caldatribacteriota bacterium]|nr:GNAT family N-acetyltransferase [Candidatus Caldatribacteriota bacterium]